MAGTRRLDPSLDAKVAVGPIARTVASLDAALREVRRLGGSVTSETRTAPGIGSWTFVADREGNELVLWESMAPTA